MSGAAVAIAEQQRRMREEEESETAVRGYGPDWEFKILRSAGFGFRKPEFLSRVLQEEAVAGWRLVEKFDNQRLRLARPIRMRTTSIGGVDAYRTYVGIAPAWFAVLIVLGTVLFFGVLTALIVLFAS